MRFASVFIFLIVYSSIISGQNLIGYKDADIRKYMKENRKDMSFNKVTNTRFIYLKYSDRFDSQTLLFFLDTDSVCRSIRIICDESIKAERIKEFNASYKPGGENRWIDSRNGKDYIIRVTDEKWSTIITMEPGK
jgi:hypothetical protein